MLRSGTYRAPQSPAYLNLCATRVGLGEPGHRPTEPIAEVLKARWADPVGLAICCDVAGRVIHMVSLDRRDLGVAKRTVVVVPVRPIRGPGSRAQLTVGQPALSWPISRQSESSTIHASCRFPWPQRGRQAGTRAGIAHTECGHRGMVVRLFLGVVRGHSVFGPPLLPVGEEVIARRQGVGSRDEDGLCSPQEHPPLYG